MPISNTGNHLKTSINALQDGMLTSRNIITKSSISQETPTSQLMHYPHHLEPTKGKKITKTSPLYPQKDLQTQHMLPPTTTKRRNVTLWSYIMTIPQPDTQEEMKLSTKSNSTTTG
jgi:hypothetical protein